MCNKSKMAIVVVFCIGLLAAPWQTAFSATIVSFNQSGTLTDIDGFQFSILEPSYGGGSGVTAANFVANWPAGWTDLSGDNIVGAADLFAPISFLPSGTVGSFASVTNPVTLGSWVLTSNSRGELFLGQDFFVQFDGTNYTVSAVPIPAAVWLLGSGVVGLVVLKRRRKA